MQELTPNEMAKRLRDVMVAENLSLRQAVARLGWDYQAVYYKLRQNGWILRSTLVYKPTAKDETREAEIRAASRAACGRHG